MKCTTDPSVIPWPDNPIEDVSMTKTKRVIDENHFIVWDMVKEGWRSFRWERVTDWIREDHNG